MTTTERHLNIYDLSLPALAALLNDWGQPAFRARQIWRQLYVNLVRSPQEMTDLPMALRERLAAELTFGVLELETMQQADGGMTRKALWRLPNGPVLESVLMIYPGRATACVSTQAGCAMGCVFCATGRMGLLRNITPGEIVEQALWAAREARTSALSPQPLALGNYADDDRWASDDTPSPQPLLPSPTRLSNLVFMGMGEPFANYDRWWQSVERLHDPQGLNMGARSLTVSTVGLVPGIQRLAEEKLPINLAISLHSPDDTLRSEMMPVNKKYPIAALLAAARQYVAKTNRRVSFEYVLLQGKNDSPEQAARLGELLRGMLCHVNLIPWNPVPGAPLHRSHGERIRAFQRVLQDAGVACTVRQERGVAIAAACGQLAGAQVAPTLAEIALV
ncbi:MAG: radical SAM protein [Roseiflexaceae bacterium]|nr:radical SAM protein [Roseiflexaceae bacterium]